MRHEEKMWSFETDQFRVVWCVSPCDDLDLSWDDDGTIRDGLESGLYTAFDSRIAVYWNDMVVGEAFLGQSIYESPSEFRDHIGAQGKYGSYFADMVREAITAARDTIRQIDKPYIRENAK